MLRRIPVLPGILLLTWVIGPSGADQAEHHISQRESSIGRAETWIDDFANKFVDRASKVHTKDATLEHTTHTKTGSLPSTPSSSHRQVLTKARGGASRLTSWRAPVLSRAPQTGPDIRARKVCYYAHSDRHGSNDEFCRKVKSQIAPPYIDVVHSFENWPENLDYGIYFFGPNNEMKKFRKGEVNPYFSGTKNILLYVHGRGSGGERGRIASEYRETFNWKMGQPRGPDVDLREAWAAKGWEVGIFYWDNFSDEEIYTRAEAKIWNSESPVGMRYYSARSGRQTSQNITVSAAELFAQAIEDVMSQCNQRGVQLRLVGHSMGAQMAIRASYLLGERVQKGLAPRRYLPARVALLDPFFSPKGAPINSPKWLGKQQHAASGLEGHGDAQSAVTTSSLCSSFASYLAERFGVLFEIYTTCPVIIENPVIADNSPVSELVQRGYAVHVRLSPDFCPAWDLECRHLSAPFLYFESMNFGRAPASAMISVPSAAMPDQVLREARGSEWEQGPGMVPCDLSTYCFRELRRPHALQDEDVMARIPAFAAGLAETMSETTSNAVTAAKDWYRSSVALSVLRFRRSLTPRAESRQNRGRD